MTWQSAFRRFAEATARYAGKPAAFLLAVLMIVGWAVTGPCSASGTRGSW